MDTFKRASLNPNEAETYIETYEMTYAMDSTGFNETMKEICQAMTVASISGEYDSLDDWIEDNGLEWLYDIPFTEDMFIVKEMSIEEYANTLG